MSLAPKIPLVRPVLPQLEDISQTVKDMLREGSLTKGPLLDAFESAVAEKLGVRHAVAVSSCTVGLMLTYQALGLTGEVIVPSFTFMATVSSMVWAGLRPVFVESDIATNNIDLSTLEQKITPRTSAIVAVHNFGNPARIDELVALAERHRLQLVFDAAHAFGSAYRGQPVGSQGEAQVFSLSPTKLVVGGEGGIVATNDPDLAFRIRRGREYGNDGTYNSAFNGLNGRLTEFSALVATRSLEMLDHAVENRNAYARYYRDRLGELSGISFQTIDPADTSSYKDFSIRVTEDEFGLSRDELAIALADANIDARKYYDPPVHSQSAYRRFMRGSLPITDQLARECLSLPIWSEMEEEILDRVCSVVEAAQRERISQGRSTAAVTARETPVVSPGGRLAFLLDHALDGVYPLSAARTRSGTYPDANGYSLNGYSKTIDEKVYSFTKGKRIMVTGAGGSIGSELVRQLVLCPVEKLILVERSEHAAFLIQQELAGSNSNMDVRMVVADINDAALMTSVFRDEVPNIVFHAAAHKHVPLMEDNPGEAVKNNVLGTNTVARLAAESGVDSFVLISTDKAVNPASVMGATKRMAEMIVAELNEEHPTKFITVRFGNVIGSTGSVTTIWQQQMSSGGPVTVTDPQMERYFMTIPEAAQSVLHAGAIAEGGEVFILEMGEPINMLRLAEEFIKRESPVGGRDVEIVITGSRPGEKLRELLRSDDEDLLATDHPKIFVARNSRPSGLATAGAVAKLEELYKTGDGGAVRSFLNDVVAGSADTKNAAGRSGTAG